MSKRKQMAYLAVILVGGVAVFVDRCVLSRTPAPASAVPLGAAPPATTHPSANAAPRFGSPIVAEGETTADLSVPEIPFPRQIPRWDGRTPLRDVFMTADETPDNGSAGAEPDGDAAADGRADFAGKHRLEAVIVQERLRIAVINGQWVRVGDAVDGCTVVNIEGNNTRFRCRDGEIVLSLTASLAPQ